MCISEAMSQWALRQQWSRSSRFLRLEASHGFKSWLYRRHDVVQHHFLALFLTPLEMTSKSLHCCECKLDHEDKISLRVWKSQEFSKEQRPLFQFLFSLSQSHTYSLWSRALFRPQKQFSIMSGFQTGPLSSLVIALPVLALTAVTVHKYLWGTNELYRLRSIRS